MKDDIIITKNKILDFNKYYDDCNKSNSINDLILKEKLLDILSWIEICIKNINLNAEDIGIISAIKYVNNMKKHSTSIFNYTLKTFALYPSNNLFPSDNLYPSDFNIMWNDLPLDNLKFKQQFINYNRYLKDQDIYITLNTVLNILEKYY